MHKNIITNAITRLKTLWNSVICTPESCLLKVTSVRTGTKKSSSIIITVPAINRDRLSKLISQMSSEVGYGNLIHSRNFTKQLSRHSASIIGTWGEIRPHRSVKSGSGNTRKDG